MTIGVFDSGLGGLTVLKPLKQKIKFSNIYYFADTYYSPYGDKSNEEIFQRTKKIVLFLVEKYRIEVLVIACNTATSIAVEKLRKEFKNLIIIGIEPGIKPASSVTKTKKIAVLATKATINGKKFKELVKKISDSMNIEIFQCACVGLVEQIENGELDTPKTQEMLKKWLLPLKEKNVDTFVLGCTHYPLIKNTINKIIGDNVNIIQTGEAVANRVISLLSDKNKIKQNNIIKQEVNFMYTGKIKIDLVNMILEEYKMLGKITI